MTIGAAPSKVRLSSLETLLCPPAVLGKGVADQGLCAREGQARVRGSPRQPCWTIAGCAGAAAGVQSKPRARGQRPPGSGAFVDAMDGLLQSVISGGSHWGPVRRWAHPLRSFPRAETWAEQRPFCAVTCQTPRGLMYGPGRSRLALDSVLSLSGRELSGPQDWRVQRAPPLPQTPM